MLLRRWFLQDQAASGDEGGSGDGAPAGGSEAANDLATMKETMSGLMETIRTLATGQADLQNAIKALTESKQANPPPPDDEVAAAPDDLETMPRKDLVDFLQKSLMKAIKKEVSEPLAGTVKNLETRLNEKVSADSVAAFQKDHPDLLEWRGEIASVLKAGRANSVADAYLIVRHEDQDKATKMDTKYAPKKPSADPTTGLKLGFQGFPPASGDASKTSRMTSGQAAAAAWDEATSAIPGIEKFLSQ